LRPPPIDKLADVLKELSPILEQSYKLSASHKVKAVSFNIRSLMGGITTLMDAIRIVPYVD
ncbi:MAG: hypothetical protein ACREEJ_00995, partial [Ensifer adhaerens]